MLVPSSHMQHSSSTHRRNDTSEPLYQFLENIIEKKVAHVALNVFEKIVDYICRHVYGAYSLRLEHSSRSRLHYFRDGAILHDQTKNRLIGIRCETRFNLVTRAMLGAMHDAQHPSDERVDYITINGVDVRFDHRPNIDTLFGQSYGTNCVVVKDNANEIIIKEYETSGNVKKWSVNPSKFYIPVRNVMNIANQEETVIDNQYHLATLI
jgi:hypothetical protein